MPADPRALHSAYTVSLLGQRDIPSSLPSAASEDDFRAAFLRADCLWANGKTAEAIKILDATKAATAIEALLADGLRALCGGDLEKAYAGYAKACAALSADVGHGDGPEGSHDPDSSSDLAIFCAERAVNVAFWQACAGKMAAAAEPISLFVESKPFAGGILSFAKHMTGDSELAEQIARKAIAKGHSDPWTLHAVAHALYSLGRIDECASWLQEARPQLPADISVFMKTHFEFHLALCLVDLEREAELWALVNAGGLWGKLEKPEKSDYWAATGPLNALWKAELRGMKPGPAEAELRTVLTDIFGELDASGVNASMPGKSKVFSLCQLRWRLLLAKKGSSAQEMSAVRASAGLPAGVIDGSETLRAVMDAVEAIYGSATEDWQTAAKNLKPVLEKLHELGASPEQREVVEEFAAVVLARSGETDLLAKWLEKNRRANVAWYDRLGGGAPSKV